MGDYCEYDSRLYLLKWSFSKKQATTKRSQWQLTFPLSSQTCRSHTNSLSHINCHRFKHQVSHSHTVTGSHTDSLSHCHTITGSHTDSLFITWCPPVTTALEPGQCHHLSNCETSQVVYSNPADDALLQYVFAVYKSPLQLNITLAYKHSTGKR